MIHLIVAGLALAAAALLGALVSGIRRADQPPPHPGADEAYAAELRAAAAEMPADLEPRRLVDDWRDQTDEIPAVPELGGAALVRPYVARPGRHRRANLLDDTAQMEPIR